MIIGSNPPSISTASRRRRNLRGTLRDAVFYAPGFVIPAALSAVHVAVFTRLFDEAAFGRYSLVFSTCMLVVFLGSGWLTHSILRFQPRYEAGGERDAFVASAFMLSLKFVLALALPPLAVGLFARGALGVWGDYVTAGALFVAGLVGYVVAKAMLQSERRSVSVSVAQVAFSVLRIGIALLLVLFVSRDAVWLIVSPAVAYLVVTPGMFHQIGLRRAVRSVARVDRQKLVRRFAVYGLPLVGRVAAERILGTADRYVIEGFRGSDDVGIYSANYNVAAMALWLAVSPVLNAAYPVLTREWEGGGRDGVPGLVTSYTRYFLLGVAILVAFIAAESQDIAGLVLGASFREGHVVMPWIAAGTALLYVGYFGDRGLYLHEKVYRVLWTICICAGVNVVLNLILVPRTGYTGAAVATLASSALYPVFVAAASRNVMPWRVPWGSVTRILLAAAAAWAVMMVAGRALDGTGVAVRLFCTGGVECSHTGSRCFFCAKSVAVSCWRYGRWRTGACLRIKEAISMNAGSGDPDPRTLDAGPVTLQCVIRGRVQGVFFRVSTRDRAQALGLTGWVRNLADGSVEAFFQGARPHCERALEFVNRGPDAARVDSVGATWGNAFDPTLTSFEIR